MIRIYLVIGVILIIGILIDSEKFRSDYNTEWVAVDSFQIKAIPEYIVGDKRPFLRVHTFGITNQTFHVHLPHKLHCEKDTLDIMVYKNSKGEIIYSKIIN